MPSSSSQLVLFVGSVGFGYPHQDSSTRKQLKNTKIGETGSHKIGKVGGLIAERKAREQLEIPGLKGSPNNWQEEAEGLGWLCDVRGCVNDVDTYYFCLIQSLTAYTFDKASQVKKGDTILVHTVAGGLWLLLAHLGRVKGTAVTDMTSTPAKVQLCSTEADVQEVIKVEEVSGSIVHRNGIWHFARHGEVIEVTRNGLITQACELEYSSALAAWEWHSVPKCIQMWPNGPKS
ncbi:hypothetical protein L208DRAFT_1374488 [Tricholoma matsutake]|nr:hypothetical protein L208DRAFT_1374488 [Tricholoma matsutake 945]